METSGLFDTPSDRPSAESDVITLEQRLDRLADVAKEGGQLAGKVRTALSQIEESAKAGGLAAAQTRITRLSESIAELSALVSGITERSVGFRSQPISSSDYIRELQSELVKLGLTVTKGPEPYWLVYPAWFKIDRDSKGSLQVVLNGEPLESVRPTTVAARIAAAVNEKFNAKQFKELLVSVRDVIRRAGANPASLALEDIFAVLSMGSGKGSKRGGEFSKEAFYYSVHRLAEGISTSPGPVLGFPPANRSDVVFFTKEGDQRKYLSVDFAGAS